MKELTKLQKAVIRQLGFRVSQLRSDDLKEVLRSITNHGIGGGFHGFIYTVDTVEFFVKNQREIISLVQDMADSLDEDMVGMVASFNCLKSVGKEDKAGIGRCLYCTHRKAKDIMSDDSSIANALSWFAAEEVARQLTEG